MTLAAPVPLLPDASVLAGRDLFLALPFGLAGLALLRLVVLRGPGRAVPGTRRPAWRRALSGAALAAVLLVLATAPAALLGAFRPSAPGWAPFAPAAGPPRPAAAAASLAYFASQSLVEELLFRAALLSLLGGAALFLARIFRGRLAPEDPAALPGFARRWWAAGLAATALQAVAFALLHAGNPHATPLALLNIGLAGAVIGWLFWSGGGLAGAWAFHAAWNFGLSALGLPVSGMALGTPLLAGPAGAGRPLLSGGTFGPEGSLAATVALALALALLAARSARKLPTG